MKIRLYTEHNLAKGGEVELTSAQAHYLKNVMRVQVSDYIYIFNGRDGEFKAGVREIGKKLVLVDIGEQTRPQQNCPDIWLLFAPIKHGRIDYLVQKATELGALALQPVFTERTVVTRVNSERMLSNVIEAAEQSERLDIPQIFEPQKLEKLIAKWAGENPERQILFCDESGGEEPIGKMLQQVVDASPASWAILTGPEGGFSRQEAEMLHSLPFTHPVSLGPRIMRADTAVIAALTAWQIHLGDWGGEENGS